MIKVPQIKAVAAGVFLAAAGGAKAQTFAADWVAVQASLDAGSCVAACRRVNAQPVSSSGAGEATVYVCKGAAPGLEIWGVRAGYNLASTPGCRVIGGADGSTAVSEFSCLCAQL